MIRRAPYRQGKVPGRQTPLPKTPIRRRAPSKGKISQHGLARSPDFGGFSPRVHGTLMSHDCARSITQFDSSRRRPTQLLPGRQTGAPLAGSWKEAHPVPHDEFTMVGHKE